MVPGAQGRSAPTTAAATTTGLSSSSSKADTHSRQPQQQAPLKSAMRRSYWSTPNVASAMRVQTLDESLHSTDLNRSRSRGKPGIDELSESRRRGLQQQQVEDAPGRPSKDNTISFRNIEVREYSRAIGDNPSVSAGAPMSIGWEYNDPDVLSVDEYESTRPPRRAHHEMVVPRSVRQDLLMNEWGYSRSQLASAVRDSNRTKTQRRTTVTNMDTPFAKIEEGVQSAKRKAKRVMFRRKSDGAMYERWKLEEARARRIIEAENRASGAGGAPPPTPTLGSSVGATSGGVADHGGLRHMGVGGPLRGENREGEAKVEAEPGGDTFELISIDSTPSSSPSDSGHRLSAVAGVSVPLNPQSLLPLASRGSPQVDEADRAASKPSSWKSAIVCAEEEDELGATLAEV